MRTRAERPVPPMERLDQVAPPDPPDWDSVRTFLDVTRCRSFRAASEKTGKSVNALRRQVDGLEKRLGVALLNRRVEGISLTSDGERILETAVRMEQESFGLLRAQEVRDARISGEVRIAVTEGLGTYWLLPKLIEYQRLNPLLVIDLRCAMHSVDVMRMEADIAIQLVRPSSADLIVTRVGTLHTMPMASPKFLEKFGIPRDLTTLQQSRIVLQEAEQLTTQSEYEALFDNHPKSGFVSVINNAGSAHLWSIIRGAGIGMLPTYVPAIGCNVEPLNVDIRRRYDVWLTFHPEMNKSPRVRQTLDWIIESFRPEKYPWFREEFIHPKDFDRLYFGGDLPKFEEEHFRVK